MPQRQLYFIRETPLARLYSKLPPERNPGKEDQIWIPRSIVEHTTKMPHAHIVTLPEWFVVKENL